MNNKGYVEAVRARDYVAEGLDLGGDENSESQESQIEGNQQAKSGKVKSPSSVTNTTASANQPRVVVEPGQDLKDLLIGGKTPRTPATF